MLVIYCKHFFSKSSSLTCCLKLLFGGKLMTDAGWLVGEGLTNTLFVFLLQNVLAKALYDNVAESPDELSFRKGDIMTVLERDTQGLDGWWLCSLHGRQGIVPGNRLKILVGMYDSKQQASPSTPDPTSQVLRPLPTKSAYPKPSLKPPGSSVGFPTKTLPGVQYTSMHPAYSTPSPAQSSPDSVYMMPPSHGPKPSSQGVYQVPSGPSGPPLQAQPAPPSKTTAVGHRQFQAPGQDIYQVPPSVGPGPGQGTAPPAGGQDVYQVPPSLEKRNWESSNKPLGKVRKKERRKETRKWRGKFEQKFYSQQRSSKENREVAL